MNTKLYQKIAMEIDKLQRAEKETDNERSKLWAESATNILNNCNNLLPSGSGFDNGSHIDIGKSKPDRIIILTSFHHMNSSGFYEGWSEHKIIITPSLSHDFHMRVTGINKNDIKEYIAECFTHDLNVKVDYEGNQIEGN